VAPTTNDFGDVLLPYFEKMNSGRRIGRSMKWSISFSSTKIALLREKMTNPIEND
jgi:hypothetical protein